MVSIVSLFGLNFPASARIILSTSSCIGKKSKGRLVCIVGDKASTRSIAALFGIVSSMVSYDRFPQKAFLILDLIMSISNFELNKRLPSFSYVISSNTFFSAASSACKSPIDIKLKLSLCISYSQTL